MTLFHGSDNANLQNELSKKEGSFGAAIFFSANKEGFGTQYYSVEEENLSITSLYEIFYGDSYNAEIVSKYVDLVADLCECEEEAAEEMLEDSESKVEAIDEDYELAADRSWALQALQAAMAFEMGFDGLEIHDETGTAYMLNSEKITIEKC